jgi:class 3 adenylate cyclase
MSEGRVERRLAAILAVDVAGYSRLMGEDEEGTLAALRAVRRELGDPKIAEHRGRIVKTTGDGLLAEFASVVDVVEARRVRVSHRQPLGRASATACAGSARPTPPRTWRGSLQQGLLDQSVDDARHAELSDPAVRLGDFDPFDRLQLVGSREQLRPDARPVLT